MSIKCAAVQCVALWLAVGSLAYAQPSISSKVGDTCKPRTIFCADGDGQSPRYLKCIHGRLEEEYCVNGSICVGSKDTTIFCAADDAGPAPAKITTVTIRVSAHPSTATRAHPYALLPTHSIPPGPPPPPTPVGLPPNLKSVGPPPLQLMPMPRPSPVPTSNTQWIAPQHPQSQPPAQPATSAAPRLLPPALQSQIWPNNRAPAAPASTHPQPPPAPHTLPSATAVSRPAESGHMLNHHPAPMFEASMPPLSAMDDDNAGSAGDIDGMAADEVLSVIGNAIFSQHPKLFSPTDDADVNAIVDATPTPQKATTMRELPAARPPQSPTVARGGLGACIPGSFTCEAHGLRPGYFACDSAGLALPASCGAADVCYQRQHLIVCGAPGKYL